MGKLAACRRVARTIYLGSAPTYTAANRGLEDRRIKLGCVMPGESPAIFGDALRRLAGSATYLYQDGPRFWYSTQPTVTKLAEDRAEQLKRDPDKAARELEKRLRQDLRQTGDFSRVHPLPRSGQDVSDDPDARLVVLSIDYPYSKEPNCPALAAAKAILETRGNVPRQYRNTLVFLAVDRTRLQDLDEAVRRYLAWESIVNDKDELDLSPHQVRQAETQKASAETTLLMRIPEAYQWLLVPQQLSPQCAVEWQVHRFNGQDALAVRASRKLRSEEQLVTSLAATPLRMELDRVPLWRGNHVAIRQLVDDFARYLYLPRLKQPQVLLAAIREGLSLHTWQQDTFAYAESYDEAGGRYRGLRCGQEVALSDSSSASLLVKPEVARRQLEKETAEQAPSVDGRPADMPGGPVGPTLPGSTTPGVLPAPGRQPVVLPPAPKPKRFYGSVELDAARVGRDASRIAEEVIAHLQGLVGARVKVTMEIEAEIPDGAPDNVVRIVTENSKTLKFNNHGFEVE